MRQLDWISHVSSLESIILGDCVIVNDRFVYGSLVLVDYPMSKGKIEGDPPDGSRSWPLQWYQLFQRFRTFLPKLGNFESSTLQDGFGRKHKPTRRSRHESLVCLDKVYVGSIVQIITEHESLGLSIPICLNGPTILEFRFLSTKMKKRGYLIFEKIANAHVGATIW